MGMLCPRNIIIGNNPISDEIDDSVILWSTTIRIIQNQKMPQSEFWVHLPRALRHEMIRNVEKENKPNGSYVENCIEIAAMRLIYFNNFEPLSVQNPPNPCPKKDFLHCDGVLAFAQISALPVKSASRLRSPAASSKIGKRPKNGVMVP